MRVLRCALATGIVAFAAMAAMSPGRAAVDQAEPQATKQFDVVPSQHPAIRNPERQLSDARSVVILRSQGVSDAVQQGFIRAAICAGLGILGLVFVGYRIYGRRHGKAAT